MKYTYTEVPPCDLFLDYTLNTSSATDNQVCEQEVLDRISNNQELVHSLTRDKINTVAIASYYSEDLRKYVVLEGFCRSTILSRLYESDKSVRVLCRVRHDKPTLIDLWNLQNKNELRTPKKPLSRAFTVRRCYEYLKSKDPLITQSETANLLGISSGLLSNYLLVTSNSDAIEQIREGTLTFNVAKEVIKIAQSFDKSFNHALEALPNLSELKVSDVKHQLINILEEQELNQFTEDSVILDKDPFKFEPLAQEKLPIVRNILSDYLETNPAKKAIEKELTDFYNYLQKYQ